MRTFLINLDRDTTRLGHMKAMLAGLGIAYERQSAIYAKELSRSELKRLFRPVRSFIACRECMPVGAIGCALSHNAVYRRMIEEDIPVALVLEDDIVIESGFTELLGKAKEFLDPSRPQILQFSAWKDGRDGNDVPDGIVEEDGLFCTDAYCVTLAAARLILKVNSPVITVADSFRRWHKRFGLELFRIYPTTVRQDNDTFGTNISGDEKRHIPSFLRSLLRSIDRLLIAIKV